MEDLEQIARALVRSSAWALADGVAKVKSGEPAQVCKRTACSA